MRIFKPDDDEQSSEWQALVERLQAEGLTEEEAGAAAVVELIFQDVRRPVLRIVQGDAPEGH